MSSRGLYMVILAALVTVAANLLMRAGVVRLGAFKLSTYDLIPQLLALARQPLFLAGVLFYGLSAIIWFSVISSEPLSTAYPILVSITFILVTAGAMLFFAERISGGKIIGIALMLAGIWIAVRN